MGILRVAIPQLVLALPGRVTAALPMCSCLGTHPTAFVQLGGFQTGWTVSSLTENMDK